MQWLGAPVSSGDLFPAFFEKALSHQLGILPKLQDKYFWKPNDIWFPTNLDKDKVCVQEGKSQESHSPFLAETYLVSKLPTNGAVERKPEWTGTCEEGCAAPASPDPGRTAACDVDFPHVDSILRQGQYEEPRDTFTRKIKNSSFLRICMAMLKRMKEYVCST